MATNPLRPLKQADYHPNVPLTAFTFTDDAQNWSLEKVEFDDFTLLVGVSGVGKTRILSAIRAVASLGTGRNPFLRRCHWAIELSASDKKAYRWEARTGDEAPDGQRAPERLVSSFGDVLLFEKRPPITIQTEKLTVEHEVIFERTSEGVTFLGQPAPKVSDTESLIHIFREEARIKPLIHHLRSVKWSESSASALNPRSDEDEDEADLEVRPTSVEQIRNDNSMSLLQKAKVMREVFPEDFERLASDYRDIFPTVTELAIELESFFRSDPQPRRRQPAQRRQPIQIGFKEKNIPNWVTAPHMSSGMRRTLFHLLELTLSPPGSIYLVDEFEEGLGVNCLPQVTELIRDRAGDIQFITTSHHPYVIKHIPRAQWKIVTRRGGQVKVLNASDVERLGGRSHQDPYTLLMASTEYSQGIDSDDSA